LHWRLGVIGIIDLGILGYSDAEEIGRGGFGTVFRARQSSVGRLVAVKVLSTVSLSDDTLKRFERECRAMAAVSSHPHITALYESGVAASGRPFIVMEYVSGGSLAARLPLAWPGAVEIGVKLAGALETAHRIGIYHRDVKPENVLLSGYGEPMLADFGVAKVADSSATPSGNITASLLHAAPETLSGARPSAATDVYSLASTVFAFIAGRAPFAAVDDEESLAPLITRIATAQVPDLRPDGVPDVVCSVLERGLAKEPSARPGSPAEFGEQLRDAQVACDLRPTEMLIEGRGRPPSVALVHPPVGDDTIQRSRSAVIAVALPTAVKPEIDPAASGAPEQALSTPPWWRRHTAVAAACVVAVVLLASTAYGATELRNGGATVTAAPSRVDVDPTASPGGLATTQPEQVPATLATQQPTLPPGTGAPAPPPEGSGAAGPIQPGSTSGVPGGSTGVPTTGRTTTTSGGAAPGGSTSGSVLVATAPLDRGGSGSAAVPPPPVVTAPGAPSRVQSGDVQIAARKDGDPAAAASQVSVLVSWDAASGTSPTYCVRWTVMSGGSAVGGPQDGGCTTSTSRRIVLDDVEPFDSWARWEVRASNSSGASGWVQAAAVVPQLVGGTSYDGTQLLRAAGMRVSYNRLGNPPSGVPNYRVTGQNPGGGAVLSGGAYVRMDFYEQY